MRNKSITKRESILKAAFGVFCDRGYYEMKMDDVARSAGVAKGTVYLYFQDKPDLYVGITKWLIGQALAIIRDIASQELKAKEKLTLIFNLWTERILRQPAAIDLVFPEIRPGHGNIARRFSAQVLPEVKRLLDGLAAVISEGIGTGEFRQVEPRLAALSFLNAFRSALLLTASNIRVKTAPARALDLFFYGIKRGGR